MEVSLCLCSLALLAEWTAKNSVWPQEEATRAETEWIKVEELVQQARKRGRNGKRNCFMWSFIRYGRGIVSLVNWAKSKGNYGQIMRCQAFFDSTNSHVCFDCNSRRLSKLNIATYMYLHIYGILHVTWHHVMRWIKKGRQNTIFTRDPSLLNLRIFMCSVHDVHVNERMCMVCAVCSTYPFMTHAPHLVHAYGNACYRVPSTHTQNTYGIQFQSTNLVLANEDEQFNRQFRNDRSQIVGLFLENENIGFII